MAQRRRWPLPAKDNRDQPIESVESEHPSHSLGGDHQPQVRATRGGPLVGAHYSSYARLIALNGSGHVRDQLSGAAVDDQQQHFSDLAGAEVVDVSQKRHDRLPACPLHPVAVRHGSYRGKHGESRRPRSSPLQRHISWLLHR